MPESNPTLQAAGRFGGRIALVTGAAGGIGFAIARRLAAEGAGVLMTDVDGARLEAAATALRQAGATVATAVADLAAKAGREKLVPAALDRWGRLDILVNNAAFQGERRPFAEVPDEEIEKIFAVNVTAAASLGRAATVPMRKQGGGAIVNVGSIQANLPVPSYAAYVASKGAIAALTRALAVELAPAGIRVNSVLPGVIATDNFTRELDESGTDRRDGPLTAALLGRQGEATEVAAAVAFLVSDEASFITGAALPVDGGRSISRRADPFQLSFGDRTEPGNTE